MNPRKSLYSVIAAAFAIMLVPVTCACASDAATAVEQSVNKAQIIAFGQIQAMYGKPATMVVSVAGGAEETFTGICDIWADDIEAAVFFEGEKAFINRHQLVAKDDTNVAWSGPSAEGSMLGAANAYELTPGDMTFYSDNSARGEGTATIFNLDDGTSGETVSMQWRVTCG
jgi:hypothetical protein